MLSIRNARKARDLTVQACADAVNVSHRTWTRYEKPSQIPPAEKLPQIADVLETSIDALFAADASLASSPSTDTIA